MPPFNCWGKRSHREVSGLCLSTQHKPLGERLQFFVTPRPLWFQAHLHVYLASKKPSQILYSIFPCSHLFLYIHSVIFICFYEGRKCKSQMVWVTGLSFHHLDFVQLFIMLLPFRRRDGDYPLSPLLIVFLPIDKRNKITMLRGC